MNDQMSLFSIPEHIENSKTERTKHNYKPKIKSAIRNQIEFINASLDDLLPEDHEVRGLWDFIDQMELSPILNKIQSTIGDRGRAATDPKILLALWVYAITQGIGSARMIDRYCEEHIGFKWLCGGVTMNYHTISDFRKNNPDEFDELATSLIANLMNKNLITLKRVSQDGCKVRANAGSSSFRRKPRLRELLAIAKEQVELLRTELDEEPSKGLNRQRAAKQRAREERKVRVEQAIKEHAKVVSSLYQSKKKHHKELTEEEKKKIRASTTDPEARKMKMANGGYNPAYNMQIAIDTKSRFIVGWYATNRGTDYCELGKMFDKLSSKYTKKPEETLVDQGYLVNDDIIKLQKQGCKVYVNPSSRNAHNPYEPKEGEDEELAEWRARMGLEESKEIYKDRAATSEWANAGMRNRGLKQLLIRGCRKVGSVLCLHVLTHNILRAIKLQVV
jgi:transposase